MDGEPHRQGHLHRPDARPHRPHITFVRVIGDFVPLFFRHVEFAQGHSEENADPANIRSLLRLMVEGGLNGFPKRLPIVLVRLHC